MQKRDIINLVDAGILHVSAHDLGPEHAYKVFQMKRAIENAHKAISDETDALLKDNGIDDDFRQKATAINKKINNREALTIEEREWRDSANDLQQVVDKLLCEMYKADIKLGELKTIPFETWRELQNENRAKVVNDKTVDILGGVAEIILADIFWRAPEEKAEKDEASAPVKPKTRKS